MNVPDTAQKAAQTLVQMRSTGQFQIDETTWGGPSIYSKEIVPIANGTVSPNCNVDARALQEIVVLARKYGQVKISDLNRRCADGTPRCDVTWNGVPPTPNSPHCAVLPTAVDYTEIGNKSVNGSNQASTDLLVFADSFIPYGGAAGQRTNCSPPAASFENFTDFFDDSCNHQHVDLRNAGATGLNVPPNTAPVANFPALRSDFTIAYQTSAGTLNTITSGLQVSNWGFALKAKTSPSVAYLPDGSWRAAYIGSDGGLWTVNSAGQIMQTGRVVAQDSSPSITALPNGKWVISFVGSDTRLRTLDSSLNEQNLGRAVAAGTSPSIAALPNSSWVVAFHGSNGTVSLESSALEMSDYNIAMAPGSNPSVTGLSNGSFALAFVGSDNRLHVFSNGMLSDFGHAIRPGTSPSVTALPGTEFVVAYVTSDCMVNAQKSTLQVSNYGKCALENTSPSIRPYADGRWFTAYVADNGVLRVVDSAGNLSNFNRPMAADTSPSLN